MNLVGSRMSQHYCFPYILSTIPISPVQISRYVSLATESRKTVSNPSSLCDKKYDTNSYLPSTILKTDLAVFNYLREITSVGYL